MEILRVDIRKVFDEELYDSVLNFKECQKQLKYLVNSTVGLYFIDSSARLPNGMMSLNLADYGDYYECLSINSIEKDMHIQGKYCTINVPFEQKSTMLNLYMKSMPQFSQDQIMTMFPDSLVAYYRNVMENLESMPAINEVISGTAMTSGLKLGLCIPKVCTVRQVERFVMSSPMLPKLTYSEGYCRLPHDKPFCAADYVAFGVFGTLFVLTILSTCYDLFQTFYRKNLGPKNRLLTSFSIYTNTRRFINFQKHKDALECVDGIRVISMLWVICGHVYAFSFMNPAHNTIDVIQWATQISTTWVSAAPIVVDTFFTLTGIFCIYIIPPNTSPLQFLKHIHVFYLYRLLRVFPLLATMVLLNASFFNWIGDGPDWVKMAFTVESCRMRWWATLLHVQNYVKPMGLCLVQSWYITVDTQLYFLSPFIIVFLLGRPIFAWGVLTLVTAGSLIAIAVYVLINEVPSVVMNLIYSESFLRFINDFYINTGIRASPFMLGLLFGYILRQHRGKRIEIPLIYVITFWLLAFTSMGYCIFGIYESLKLPYHYTIFDGILNAFMRGLWGASIGWLILACTHGYGGPINWMLSLEMWKIPSRLSYAVFIVHLQIIILMKSMVLELQYFSSLEFVYDVASVTAFSFVISFCMCVLIDAPSSTLVKLMFTRFQPVAKTDKEDNMDDETICEKNRY